MTLDSMLHESLPPRSQASAAEAALPTVLDHLTDVLLSNNFSSKEYAMFGAPLVILPAVLSPSGNVQL
jgi:hypothetical protein